MTRPVFTAPGDAKPHGVVNLPHPHAPLVGGVEVVPTANQPLPAAHTHVIDTPASALAAYVHGNATPSQHPIDRIQWVDRDLLQANSWNPNHVAPPELDLLRKSILEDGWASAIVVQEVQFADGTLDHYEIVDGFHRWTVSGHPDVGALTQGKVPVVVVTVDPAHARISTVRFNRARGSHAVASMSDIVVDLIEVYDLPDEEVMDRLGMDHEEVRRLRERGRMVTRQTNPQLGEAWRPSHKPAAQ